MRKLVKVDVYEIKQHSQSQNTTDEHLIGEVFFNISYDGEAKHQGLSVEIK